ncbi:sensor histidine kinase [Winogradskyella flava]|uniref:sensor histidine kinase n=1 Tax=Winogradskyella flava TaxID=1884876 RepID=UPI00248F5FB5|nr:ATP-binding protein [Winogradskyella flava]
MKIENHILDILQLYEYAMAIGKSSDYKESCDLFLKLLLKRKNLNASWILEKNENHLQSSYSIPLGDEVKKEQNASIATVLEDVKVSKLLTADDVLASIAPIEIESGVVAIFNLDAQGYLFLYTKKDNISLKDITQLQPVINKFSTSLKACKAFSAQEKLLKSLEIQNQELSDYAHMVSHDLKSPLRSIDTLTAWLKDDYSDKLDASGNKNLGLIRNSVEKMDTLINGILAYSTIGKNRFEVYDVDLNNLVKDVLSLIRIPDHIDIITQDLPVIKGDKYRLQQLFQNLITNAVAYNDKDKGLVEIDVKDQNEFWQFSVKDNGIGIEETYFEKIFKTFQKLENNEASTGIGLSIVKKIVDLYGGTIWLTSELGKGTTFYFTLKKQSNGTA